MSYISPAGVAPTKTWCRFLALSPETEPPAAGATRVDRYRITGVTAVCGEPITHLHAEDTLLRLESEVELPGNATELSGVTQHLGYTTREERQVLTSVSTTERGPIAVLIPIRKSPAWWALAQDERSALLRGKAPGAEMNPSSGPPPGHIAVGLDYARTILRKLYHARPLVTEWDFLTYFEFPAERAADFRSLLAGLRDVNRNPEWAYVDRESEVWMERLL
jgi:hypothetical protein